MDNEILTRQASTPPRPEAQADQALRPEAQADQAPRQRVVDSIFALLPGVLGRELPSLTEDTLLMAELGLRSASMLELLLGIEDDLGVEIDVEEISEAGMRSVGDLADFVASHTITYG